MFRQFRHKLFVLLEAGIIASGVVAVALQPAAWPAVAICTVGAVASAWGCASAARHYLRASLGRLRRVADEIGRGGPAVTMEVHPGDDMYKLTNAVNVLAARLAEANQEEQRLHEELRRRERLAFLGELAASVAHEVNNPLDGVQNCARILRRALDDPARAAQMLDLIDSGLQRIELIVRRLLTLAREHVVRPVEARMGEIVTAALAVVAPRMEGRAIRVRQHMATDEDRALIDTALLEQVFVNLLLNAIDSMPQGGELSVTVRRELLDALRVGGAREAFVSVDVSDTGTGISADVLPHIFEPFFTTKTGGKGTGLGLAIASRIVDAHRGHITVAPRAGGGTTFTVRIPARAACVEAGPTAVPVRGGDGEG